jgi:cytochrome c biogenesis protein CcmG/thiol:disulfide interchange protein DsbE
MSTASERSIPAQESSGQASRRTPRLAVYAPLVVFLALAALFYFRLGGGDPSEIPSALIGRPAPQTDLPPIPGLQRDGKPLPGIVSAEFPGAVTVLNVWASWCVPCRTEAPFLMRLAEDRRIRLVGLNYKDQTENALRFLDQYGNPYVAAGADMNGRTGIEWGVYGVPETFVLDRDGRIAFKLIGPVTATNLQGTLKPAIEKALAGS